MRKLLLSLLIVILLSGNCLAGVDISTPWSDSEQWEDTWQGDTVVYANGLWNQLGKGLLGGWFGKKLKDGHKKREKALEDNIKQRMKEEMPVDYLAIYEDYLHKLDVYAEYEKEIKSIDDLDTLIDHLQKQKNKLGDRMNKKFDEYLERLKHLRDKEKEYQEKFQNQVNTQALMTIALEIIALLGLMAAGMAGVGA